jgi:hypothetical protein
MVSTLWLGVLAQTSGGQLPSGNIPANDGFGAMVLRIGLFMIGFVVFFFICGYAWKTIPALRALLPGPKPEDQALKDEPRLVYRRPTPSPTPEEAEFQPQTDAVARAIADGQPGSVVRAASLLDEDAASPSIIIIHRED